MRRDGHLEGLSLEGALKPTAQYVSDILVNKNYLKRFINQNPNILNQIFC